MADTKKDIVIRAKSVTKDFLLPHEKNTSVKSTIVNIFRSSKKGATMQHALQGVSFEIEKGEFFGILGRNGSGKSTLLKILAEIYQPTEGSVDIKGKLVPFIELGVGFNPELTGRENVFLNGALLGFSRKEIEDRYEDIVAFAELEDFMDQKLKNYSSGMQVRLAFSVATRAEADILLVDEVLAVGDADFQRKCFDYFKSLKKSHKTVIFVTHDMNAVREYCDRAILIKDGLVAHEGAADKVANEYLKLFNKSDEKNQDKDSSRWGNGQVKVANLTIHDDDDEIKISSRVRATKDTDGFVFGYRFLNSEGKLMMGGNSLNANGGKKLSLKKDEELELTFKMPNILGSGTATLGVTVRLSDGVTMCDVWDDAARLEISKAESYYPVVAPATMEVR